MLILDTDHLTLLQWGHGAEANRLRARLSILPPGDVVATIISFEEQTRGWMVYLARAKLVAQQVEAYRRLVQHLDHYRSIPVIPFDELAAIEFQRLAKLRLRLGTMDLRIASIAVSRGVTLLTRNAAHFGKVPGLAFENWTL